jgi:hypothetical protein
VLALLSLTASAFVELARGGVQAARLSAAAAPAIQRLASAHAMVRGRGRAAHAPRTNQPGWPAGCGCARAGLSGLACGLACRLTDHRAAAAAAATASRAARLGCEGPTPRAASAWPVRRPLRPLWPAVWTEIYLCDVCSCQEILRRNGRGQLRVGWMPRAWRRPWRMVGGSDGACAEAAFDHDQNPSSD